MLSIIIATVLATTQELSFDQVKAASTAFRTIEPADDQFEDLQFLKEKIGSSRIVMLGEASHGDGSTFLAKTRLVKFLHREMGFDVLAWESGFFDCSEMDKAFQHGEKPFVAGSKGIFSLWSYSEQIQPLLQYIASTQKSKRRLEVAGFDHQVSSPHTSKALANQLLAFFDQGDPGLLSPWNRRFLHNFHLDFTLGKRPGLPDYIKLKKQLNDIYGDFKRGKSTLRERHGVTYTSYMERCLRNLIDYMEFGHRWFASKRVGPDNNFRDQRMAENLKHLVQERYRGRKIIVWSASFHNMRSMSNIDGPPNRRYKETVPMGEVFASYGIPSVFSLAFICDSGTYGIFNGPYDLPPTPIGALEHYASLTGSEFLFINAKMLPQRFTAKVLGHVPMMGDWPASFEGFIFLKKMKPSTIIKYPDPVRGS